MCVWVCMRVHVYVYFFLFVSMLFQFIIAEVIVSERKVAAVRAARSSSQDAVNPKIWKETARNKKKNVEKTS